MNLSKTNLFCVCVVGLVLISPAHNAPRYRNRERNITKYDQQQNGDYNIQLHLKDFHIVAVLGDGSWGSYGDYDYNYDYSDLTIKPIIPITTPNPQNATESESEPTVEEGTQKPNNHPYPIVSPPSTNQPPENPLSTTPTAQSTTARAQSTSLKAQSITPGAQSTTPGAQSTTPRAHSTTPNAQSTTTSSPTKAPAVSASTIASSTINEKLTKGSADSTTKKSELQSSKGPKKESGPEASTENFAATENKKESPVTNVSIVPAENLEVASTTPKIPLAEIVHYRKCGDGYTQDKQGRCRKIRRTPSIPFGIARFATNIASRFRQAAIGSTH